MVGSVSCVQGLRAKCDTDGFIPFSYMHQRSISDTPGLLALAAEAQQGPGGSAYLTAVFELAVSYLTVDTKSSFTLRTAELTIAKMQPQWTAEDVLLHFDEWYDKILAAAGLSSDAEHWSKKQNSASSSPPVD